MLYIYIYISLSYVNYPWFSHDNSIKLPWNHQEIPEKIHHGRCQGPSLEALSPARAFEALGSPGIGRWMLIAIPIVRCHCLVVWNIWITSGCWLYIWLIVMVNSGFHRVFEPTTMGIWWLYTGWWWLEHLDYCSIYWEVHNPNWPTHIFIYVFQRGRYTTNKSNIIPYFSVGIASFFDWGGITW